MENSYVLKVLKIYKSSHTRKLRYSRNGVIDLGRQPKRLSENPLFDFGILVYNGMSYHFFACHRTDFSFTIFADCEIFVNLKFSVHYKMTFSDSTVRNIINDYLFFSAV